MGVWTCESSYTLRRHVAEIRELLDGSFQLIDFRLELLILSSSHIFITEL